MQQKKSSKTASEKAKAVLLTSLDEWFFGCPASWDEDGKVVNFKDWEKSWYVIETYPNSSILQALKPSLVSQV